MTRKRYRKLLYALMQKIGKRYCETFGEKPKDWGRVLKDVLDIKVDFGKTEFRSYQEIWDNLLTLRKFYGM